MKTIKHILSRYTAFLWTLLKPLGAWGVLVVPALDGAFIGLPVDAVVAGYVYQNPARFLLYALMASVGSTLGSIVIYVIGYKGGEELLRKRVKEAGGRWLPDREQWVLPIGVVRRLGLADRAVAAPDGG